LDLTVGDRAKLAQFLAAARASPEAEPKGVAARVPGSTNALDVWRERKIT